MTISIDGVNIVEAMADEGHRLVLKTPTGRDPLDKEIQSKGRPGSSGERLTDVSLPSRTIGVEFNLISSDRAERLKAGRLLGRLMGHGLREVEFDDDDGNYYLGVVSNNEGDQWLRFGRGELRIFCPQPFLYGDEETTTPAGGVLLVESNYYVEPVILWRVDDQVGAAWIEVDGYRLTIDTGMSEDQQISIDCARKETRIGGVLNVENIRGVYPRVFDGSTIETSPGGTINMTYQARWS